ncbi:SUZ domain-containing protein 1 isoform X2 [Nycticebus coucang]|uniref:SUZ domain-containing protein 1 isoform X2 n=1 Tax=Nycticebus coucang TaxID=9470 RepID=UPI00234D1EFD|nr:SUZ domain-containing protein 1 isoform X2 [Nycticebus coucang]
MVCKSIGIPIVYQSWPSGGVRQVDVGAESAIDLSEGMLSSRSTTDTAASIQEIDRRLEKKLKITQKERKSKSPPKVPIVIQDDSLPTGPPPQIRILKRPTSNGVVSSPNSTSRPALPVKSLAQREAEYAEARKRILGSASPEEEQEKPILDRPTRISQPEDSRQPNNVIRQPLGPDGSQGFKQRR